MRVLDVCRLAIESIVLALPPSEPASNGSGRHVDQLLMPEVATPVAQDVLNYFSNYNVANRAFELPEPSAVASKRVLVMTCGAAGILRCGDYAAHHKTCKAREEKAAFLTGLEFSHVLIDEAGQVDGPFQQLATHQ